MYRTTHSRTTADDGIKFQHEKENTAPREIIIMTSLALLLLWGNLPQLLACLERFGMSHFYCTIPFNFFWGFLVSGLPRGLALEWSLFQLHNERLSGDTGNNFPLGPSIRSQGIAFTLGTRSLTITRKPHIGYRSWTCTRHKLNHAVAEGPTRLGKLCKVDFGRAFTERTNSEHNDFA